MPKPTVVSFDCADTLVRNGYTPHGFARQCAEAAGLELPPEAYQRYLMKFGGALAGFHAVNRTRDEAACGRWWDEFVTEWLAGEEVGPEWVRPLREAGRFIGFEVGQTMFPLFEDTKPVLDQLRSEGYRLIVISNWDITLRRVLRAVGIEDYFEFVFASLEEGVEKPEAALFEIARSALKVAPGEILHVGDDPVDDLGGASDFGMHALLLDRSGTVPGSISSLLEVPGRLASIV